MLGFLASTQPTGEAIALIRSLILGIVNGYRVKQTSIQPNGEVQRRQTNSNPIPVAFNRPLPRIVRLLLQGYALKSNLLQVLGPEYPIVFQLYL